MGAAVLRSQDALAFHHHHHHRASSDSSVTTPPPKPNRGATRADRSSPPSAPRSGYKAAATPSPAKPGSQARPGRKVRFNTEDSPPPRRAAAAGARMVAKLPGRNLVMGEVTILKRGDDPKARVAAAATAAPVPASIPAPATKPSPPSPPASDRAPEDVDAAAQADDVVFSSTERLGPDPEILPKQIRLTNPTKPSPAQGLGQKTTAPVYAGSAFITSPSPSCLPFPASFFNKDLVEKAEAATNTLKYLLRLDLA